MLAGSWIWYSNLRRFLELVSFYVGYKSHVLVALGVAVVEAGHRVRYFTAAELVETLYWALADNSVVRVIETLLRNDQIICDELGFAPLGDTGAHLLFRFVAAAYERRSLGIGSHRPFEKARRIAAYGVDPRTSRRPTVRLAA